MLRDPWGLLAETSGGLRGDVGLLWLTCGAFGVPWIALWKGLLAFWEAFGALCWRFGESLADPWGLLGALGNTYREP